MLASKWQCLEENREFIFVTFRKLWQPQRKVHLSDELVAKTMSELYISNPRPKIARRSDSKSSEKNLMRQFSGT